MFDKNLCEFFKENNIVAKFEDFKNLLIEKNKMFNLTSITEDEQIYVKHFYDSLMGESLISINSKVIEIGSGGGFPSVPLKIYRDDLNFTLVEATNKKCTFLNEVKTYFSFKNFEINCARCEDLAKNLKYRENFDVCVARAVASLNTLLEYCLPFVKKGGIFIAYKGEDKSEIEQSKNALSVLGGKIKEIKEYYLPENMGKRSLIIIEKINETPIKYPRGNGKERSKPL